MKGEKMAVTLKTVVLDSEKCIGCITCMRRCPTEAIRIENGKAKILYDKCINCGECVRSCKGGAKRPVYDSFDLVASYKYKIALPSPSLFGQFNNLDDPNYVIEGLLALGFDEVFEVGLAAELVTDCTKKLMENKDLARPVISTACPAVAELILLKFHELADHMLPVYAPAKIAAKLAKKQALEKGVPADDIGIFFISPCPAKVYSLHKEEVSETKYISGVLSQSDIYFRLVDKMNKIKNPRKLGKCGYSGIGWGSSGGESNSLGLGNYIHCSGTRNILELLKEMSDGKLDGGADFVEMNMCPGGCVGGGGQPIHDGREMAEIRSKNLYFLDSKNELRFSHENPEIKKVYDEYLEKPLSRMAHKLLHTDHDAWEMPLAPKRTK